MSKGADVGRGREVPPVDARADIAKAVDFAYPVFRARGWSYYDGRPTKARLRKALRRMVRDAVRGACQEEPWWCSVRGGRFTVIANFDEYDMLSVAICLDLANAHAYAHERETALATPSDSRSTSP